LVKLSSSLNSLCFSNLVPLLQSNSINIPQLGQQLSSTLHSQQRHESSLDDRLKASAAPFNDTKPFLSSGGQSSAASSDASSIQKVAFTTDLFDVNI
jgi:CCR4-NOT transcription complex subunit 1